MTGYKASQLVRDAEALGILRWTRLGIRCPSCGEDAGVRMTTGVADCKCGTQTDLRALVTGELGQMMQRTPRPAAREWEQ